MGMIMDPAKTEIKQVGRDYQCYSRNQKPVLVPDKKLFQYKESKTQKEKN